MASAGFRKLEGLDKVIAGLEGQASWQRRRQFRQVIDHWPKAVGYVVARQTKPLSIDRQVLYVAAATSAWSQTLALERLRILEKLNAYLSSPLKDMRFSTAQWATKSLEPPVPTTDQFWRDHPSYIDPQTIQPQSSGLDLRPSPSKPDGAITKAPPKLTALEAFQNWERVVRSHQKSQTQCPQCECPCPPKELVRWQTCALCAAQRW